MCAPKSWSVAVVMTSLIMHHTSAEHQCLSLCPVFNYKVMYARRGAFGVMGVSPCRRSMRLYNLPSFAFWLDHGLFFTANQTAPECLQVCCTLQRRACRWSTIPCYMLHCHRIPNMSSNCYKYWTAAILKHIVRYAVDSNSNHFSSIGELRDLSLT
jgi:hypothetical protein